jgi:hypothetical protein
MAVDSNSACEEPLFPPVVGRFINGRGEFYGDDTYNRSAE